MTTGPRTEIKFHAPLREECGSWRTWGRTMNGKEYHFTAVLMPDGERRYFASRYDGDPSFRNGRKFACYWTRVFSFTVKPAGK